MSIKYIREFNSIRGISIILVLITHLDLFAILPENSFFQENIWRYVSGRNGVTIFFTLSGFLITKILLLEREKTGSISLKRFFIKRFLRLTPPLIIFYIITTISILNNITPHDNTSLIYAICYLYNYVPKPHYIGEYGHLWSLSLEEQFYLIWPIIFKFLFKQHFIVIISCLSISVSAFIFNVSFSSYFPNHLFDRFFFPASYPIFIGALFAIIDKKTSIGFHFWKKNIFALILFLTPLILHRDLLYFSDIIFPVFYGYLFVIFFERKITFKFLPLEYLGKISYGVYVYQGFFLKTGPSSDFYMQKPPLNILLTMLTSVISYEFFEKKILKFKNNF